MKREALDKAREAARSMERRADRGATPDAAKDRGTEATSSKPPPKEPDMPVRDRGRGVMDLGL